MDGSQKLPQRMLDTLFENLAAGRPCDRLLTVVAAWFRFLQTRARAGAKIDDPLAPELTAAARAATDDRALVANLLGIEAVFCAYPAAGIAERLVGALHALDALTGPA